MTVADTPLIAFSSDDLNRAWEEWKCNCGPAALAACLGWTPDAVRPYLGDFEDVGYMNPTMMSRSLRAAGFRHHGADPRLIFPTHGVVRVQWGGPWLLPGAHPRAAYRYTHWVATKRLGETLWVFDVNAGWEPLKTWEHATKPLIVASIKRADGSFSFTHRWEVRKA